MILQSPERSAPPSRHADWIELNALLAEGTEVGLSDLSRVLRMEEPTGARHFLDEAAGEIVEGEIAEDVDQQVVQDVLSELQRRSEAMGTSYPFNLHQRSNRSSKELSISVQDWKLDASRYVYLFCLLISAIRHELVALESADRTQQLNGKKLHSEYRYGFNLQICASVALGGYLLGEVVSFGYPRPNRSRFLAAHAQAWLRFGAYSPVSSVPQALQPSTKDGGIDLIGWVHFPDLKAAKVLVFGQVASGFDWTQKPVGHYVDRLKHWFTAPSFTYWCPALAIPFEITDAGNFIRRQGALTLRESCLIVEESTFGVIFDRERLTSAVNRYHLSGEAITGDVDQVANLPLVLEWVEAVIGQLAAA